MSPTVYAHRGASHELPENTLEAFDLALSLGASALETDAHMTRDGRVVLSHDGSGDRMAGVPIAIRDATLLEVRSWNVGARFTSRATSGPGAGLFRADDRFRVPTLEEALDAFPGVLFNVDAKQTTPDMIPALLRAIRACRAEDRVRIASFSGANLTRVRALGYTGETGLSPAEIARVMFVPRSALWWLRVDGHAAQVPRSAYGVSFASQRAIDRLHAVGVRVDFWTVDDPAEARRLLAMGADGVMTDDPRRLCEGLGLAGRNARQKSS